MRNGREKNKTIYHPTNMIIAACYYVCRLVKSNRRMLLCNARNRFINCTQNNNANYMSEIKYNALVYQRVVDKLIKIQMFFFIR